MRKLQIAVKILLCFKLAASKSSPNNEIELIVDVVDSYEKPTAVLAKICWELKQKVNLVTKLGSLSNPKTVNLARKNTIYRRSISKDIIIVADISCPDIKEFLLQANATKLFRGPNRWLIFGGTNYNNVVPSVINNFNILLDSEVIVSKYIGNEDQFELHFVYKISNTGSWITELFGTWNRESGLTRSKSMQSTTLHFRRRNLGREPVRSSFVITDEQTKISINDISNRDSITRLGYRTTTPLYEFLNATREMIFTDNWGHFANGSWNGMMGKLYRGEADISGTSVFITNARLDIVNYLANLVKSKSTFVFREPSLTYQNNLFLLPFRASVWYCLIGFIPIPLLILYVNARWEKVAYDKSIQLGDIAMNILSAIAQQGTPEMKGIVERIVMFTLFLTFLFLYTSYSANIVALLQSNSNQIRTLKDLLESRLELGVEDTPYSKLYFSTATEPIRKAIYETKVAPRGSKPKFMSLDDGIMKLQSSPFAFNMETGPGYKLVEKYFYEHEKCGLHEISYLPPQNPWLCCRKDTPFAEILKIGVYKLREVGISDRENKLFYSEKPKCQSHAGSFDSVNLVDVYPALLMLLYGAMIAVSLLFFEILANRVIRKNLS